MQGKFASASSASIETRRSELDRYRHADRPILVLSPVWVGLLRAAHCKHATTRRVIPTLVEPDPGALASALPASPDPLAHPTIPRANAMITRVARRRNLGGISPLAAMSPAERKFLRRVRETS
jgi:hypothetical protein